MNENITFAAFRALLESLGFSFLRAESGYYIADHPESGCKFVFSSMEDHGRVPYRYLVLARHNLDTFGVLGRKEFEQMLDRAVLAG